MNKQITPNNTGLFYQHEIEYISSYLGLELTADIRKQIAFEKSSGGVRLLLSMDMSRDEDDAINNAIARLILNSIEQRLPQWASVNINTSDIHFSRKYESSTSASKIATLLPTYLFTINWADSGPGFSWPEAYYVGYLPYFDVYVVTASNDSTDMHGYCDRAIGWFSADKEIKDACKKVIVNEWQQQNEEQEQQHWAYLFDTGLIDEDEAYAWASEVWTNDGENN